MKTYRKHSTFIIFILQLEASLERIRLYRQHKQIVIERATPKNSCIIIIDELSVFLLLYSFPLSKLIHSNEFELAQKMSKESNGSETMEKRKWKHCVFILSFVVVLFSFTTQKMTTERMREFFFQFLLLYHS